MARVQRWCSRFTVYTTTIVIAGGGIGVGAIKARGTGLMIETIKGPIMSNAKPGDDGHGRVGITGGAKIVDRQIGSSLIGRDRAIIGRFEVRARIAR